MLTYWRLTLKVPRVAITAVLTATLALSGLPAKAQDQSVEAVYLATLAAREHALSGKGPVLLHMRTHRLVGHYIGDPQLYRDRDELKRERETKDPVDLLRARLEISDEDFASLDEEVTAEVEAAVEFAKAGTDPKPEDALKYVYA